MITSLVRDISVPDEMCVLTFFLEQEITGDVLLELDANVLKTEIGITQYGKRVRIANAIAELRRPPSIDEQVQGSMPTPRSLTNSFNYPGSHHSHPSHSHTHSIQSSAQQSFVNSPMFGPPSPLGNGLPSAGLTSITSADSGPQSAELPASSPTAKNGWRASDPGSIHNSAINLDEEGRGRGLVGLGLGLPNTSKAPVCSENVLPPPVNCVTDSTPSVLEGAPRRARAVTERWRARRNGCRRCERRA